jgi:hypothetical protein
MRDSRVIPYAIMDLDVWQLDSSRSLCMQYFLHASRTKGMLRRIACMKQSGGCLELKLG